MSEIAPGWYKDPADPSTQRYWDGEGWLGTPLPADAKPPDGPPPAEGPLPPAATQSASPAAGLIPATDPAQAPPGPPPASTPPAGWTPPPGSGPPQGWTPPPPGWTPPPGWAPPPPGSPPLGWAPPGAPGTPGGMHVVYGFEPQVRPHGFALAGLGPRLMARLLDIFAVLLLNIVVNGWFAYQWWQEIWPIMSAALQDPMGSPPEPTERSQYLLLTMLFIATALWLAYEVPAIGSNGQTPGKRIMHIRVVRVENLDPIGYGRAFSRWARLGMWTTLWWCYGIGLLFQLIDSASVLFDKKMRQALHDKTAHTIVVDAPPPAKRTTSPSDESRPGGDGQRDADARGGSTAGNGVPDDGSDPTGGAR